MPAVEQAIVRVVNPLYAVDAGFPKDPLPHCNLHDLLFVVSLNRIPCDSFRRHRPPPRAPQNAFAAIAYKSVSSSSGSGMAAASVISFWY